MTRRFSLFPLPAILLTGILFCVLTPSVQAAAPPALFFSDLDSGPKTGGENNKGVYVTVYGKNFGSTRGSSSISIGGGTADNYPVWSDTKVTFQLGANAQSGNIVLTTSNGASNSLPFTVRSGNIYFVTPNGTGSGTISSPAAPTLIYNSAQAGDTFYLRAGSYSGQYGDTSWQQNNFSFGPGQRGTLGNPIAMLGYPGETATLTSPGRANIGFDDSSGTGAYTTVANLTMIGAQYCIGDGGFYTDAKSGAIGLRIVNNVFSATYNSNTGTALVQVGGDGNRVFGNEFKDTGTSPPINQNHGIYVHYGAADAEIAWNYFHNLRMGHVIQVHTDAVPGGVSCYTFNNIRIHDNLLTATNIDDSRGINVGNACDGSDGSIYNNALYHLGQDFSGIAIYNGHWKVFNNTLSDIHATTGMLWIQGSTTATVEARNNIFFSNGSSPYIAVFAGASMSQFTLSNNLYFGNGSGPATDTTKVGADPLFVNAASGDLHLQSNSPAIDAGTNSVNAVVTRDRDGNLRPIGAAYDIGAYEYGTPTPDTTPPTSPTTLAATAPSSSSISVSWTASTDNVGVANYIVERCQGSGCSNFTQVGTPSASPFVDSGLTASTSYNYHVRAIDGAGNLSGWSNVVGATTLPPDTTPPSAPSNLSATAASSSQIDLTWTVSTDNVAVTSYQVERCQGSNCSNFTQVATPTSNSYSDTSLASSTLYRYRVRASDGSNFSTYSNTAEATTAYAPITMGQTVQGTSIDNGNNGRIYAQQATLSQTATLQSLSFYVSSGAGGSMHLAVYSDSSGTPGTLLASTSDFTPVNGWNTQNVTAPISLTVGTYWLAYEYTATGLQFVRQGTSSFKAMNHTWGALPTTFGSITDSGTTNWSFYATLTASPDSTPPTLALTAPAQGATVSGTSVTVSADASDNVGVAGVQFKLDGANLGTEDTSSPYAITWDTTQVANASHTLTAIARDGAGNTTTSASRTVTVSNTDPIPPTILSLTSSPSSGFFTTGSSLTLTTTFSEAVTSTGSITLTLETGSTDRTCSFTITNSSSAACTYTVQAGDTSSDLTTNSITGTIRDQAGNLLTNFTPATTLAQSSALVIDTTAPNVFITSPTEGSTVSGTQTLSATATDTNGIAGVQFKLDGTNLGSEDLASPYSLAWNTAQTTNSPHLLTATARDQAGNTLTSSAITVTVSNGSDTTPPALTQITPIPSVTRDSTPDYTFSSTEAGTLTLSGGCTTATTSVSAGNTSLTLNTLTPGTYATCSLRVTDSSSNQSSPLSIGSFTLTYPSDLNLDRSVNVLDFSLMKTYYGTTNSQGDVNFDGSVNVLDFGILKAEYGQSV